MGRAAGLCSARRLDVLHHEYSVPFLFSLAPVLCSLSSGGGATDRESPLVSGHSPLPGVSARVACAQRAPNRYSDATLTRSPPATGCPGQRRHPGTAASTPTPGSSVQTEPRATLPRQVPYQSLMCSCLTMCFLPSMHRNQFNRVT